MDKYYIYRPLLDLIGFTEGTDKKRGYNETLAYGAYTGGDVNLVGKTLKQIDQLQTQMLDHPKNKWNSSAIGRYQIVRTTLRAIKKTLNLSDDALFNEEMQDMMCCFLLGRRHIDAYLSGDFPEDNMMVQLAQEWASFPTPAGKGYYDGQNAAVKPDRVRQVLSDVKVRKNAPPPAPKPQPQPLPVTETAACVMVPPGVQPMTMMMGSTREAKAMNSVIEEAVTTAVSDPKVDANNSAIQPIANEVQKEVLSHVLHATNNEPWYQSRVTWGAIVSIVLPILGAIGVQTDVIDADTFASVGVAIGTALGGILSLYGRWVATKPIGS